MKLDNYKLPIIPKEDSSEIAIFTSSNSLDSDEILVETSPSLDLNNNAITILSDTSINPVELLE